MKSTPLVSVIIPCYNAENYVESAVLSIMNQTYKNLQIICINDGSRDNTNHILHELALMDDRVEVINNIQNIGLIQTLNKGIDLAKGEYIARMDSDDISHKDRILLQLKYLQTHDCDICGSNINYVDEDGNIIGRKIWPVYMSDSIILYSLFDSPVVHPSILAKASIFRTNRYHDEISNYACEDYELWSRMIISGIKFGVVDEILLDYRINSSGVSYSNADIQNENFLAIAKTHCSTILNSKVNIDIIKIISGRSGYLKIKDIKDAIRSVEVITDYFRSNYNSDCSREFKNWKDWKILYILSRYMRSSVYNLFKAFPLLLSNHQSIFNLVALKSILANLKF